MRRPICGIACFCLLSFVALPALVILLLRSGTHVQVDQPQALVKVAMPGGSVITMDLEVYVRGVLCAEMPASFHREALAAQAVAARTYAVRRLLAFPDAPISADPAVHQGWESDSAAAKGLNALEAFWYRRKVGRALAETRGDILVCAGAPIDAVYHSTSGAFTASAEEAWGQAVPYLKSVPCPYCADSPRLKWELPYDKAEAMRLMQATLAAAPPTLVRASAVAASGQGQLAVVARTQSGRVAEVLLGGSTISGTQVRAALGLPSTKFGVVTEGEKLVFEVEGFGHGVGMCQYGANGMATQGADFRDILAYYYEGATIASASTYLWPK